VVTPLVGPDGLVGAAVGTPLVGPDGLVGAAAVVPPPVVPPGTGEAGPVGGPPERVAPAAGVAVKISGTTQAATPAVATVDMRPMAWRLEIWLPSEMGQPGARCDAAASPCVPSLCMTTAPYRYGELDRSLSKI